MFHSSATIRFYAFSLCFIVLLWILGCDGQLTEPESPLLIRVHAPFSDTDCVRVFIQAQVSDVDDPNAFLNGQINVGDKVDCVYLYDPTCSDSKNHKHIGQYVFDTPSNGMTILINNLVFSSDSSSVDMTILLKDNAHKQSLHDEYDVSSSSNLEVLPGVGVSDMTVHLDDLDAGALSSDSLLASAPELSDWPLTHEITIKGKDGWTILANITAISACSIVDGPVERHKTKDRFQRQ